MGRAWNFRGFHWRLISIRPRRVASGFFDNLDVRAYPIVPAL